MHNLISLPSFNMKLHVNRIQVRLDPDFKKVIPRFFNTGEERSKRLLETISQMPEEQAANVLKQVLSDFRSRYKNIHEVFEKHFDKIKDMIPGQGLNLSTEKKLLIGSYFTMEYSVEAAALFNPSIVEDPDQSGAGPGEKNVLLSFRATGESHISSLVFKRAKLDKLSMIHIEPSGKFLKEGEVNSRKLNGKAAFEEMLATMKLPKGVGEDILVKLKDNFSYYEIESAVRSALDRLEPGRQKTRLKYDILSMVNTSYELKFDPRSYLSERVIFPVTFTEKNGIEDARFVKFTDEDDSSIYIATYTAYDGTYILPHLIETKDFLHFKVSPLHGKSAINKNLALFPRKVNGKYVMLSRIDGFRNYIMFSDDLYLWETATVLQEPKFPWELVQIGNGGSPIETDRGWLVITHGVGPMRRYCLGASLFDLEDPTIELGRLNEPLLMPNEHERFGYVPNVVYSCGAMVHEEKLFIPYAVSDHATSFATINLKELLDEILVN
jgi:predicted GH43/DUF377 family glycosyl hydrolase